jgi:SPP1 gp7 family putative phage head morphogenesis protein
MSFTTDKDLEELFKGVFNGTIDIYNLPVNLYESTFAKLESAFNQIDGKPSKQLLANFTDNLRLFSAAKTYQNINDLSLIKLDEQIKTFKEFKEEALKIHEQYNVNWLKTEYNTTIGQSQMATRWEQIEEQKKEFPYLQYIAVIDSKTSEICKPLDGVALPINDKFWNTNSPLNHFGCRCTLKQLMTHEASVTSKEKADAVSKEMNETRQPLFNTNPYRDKVIFSKDHPYFDIPKKDKEYARNNFNLPTDGKPI